MQGRDGKPHSNAPYEHASSIASNDGTLNAIVHKSVRSLDVPFSNAIAHEDEMLSWLHYPMEDPLDRGYCSDVFGDLPKSSAQVLRHSFNQAGLRPPSISCTSIFSGMLSSHQNTGFSSMDRRTALSESTRDAAESCGSRLAEASGRVAGADAVAALGVYRVAGFKTSDMGTEVFSKLDSEGEVLSKMGSMVQPTCNSASANAMFNMQSEMSQSLSQGSSQQQASFAGHGHAPYPGSKPLDFVNCYMPPVPTGKPTATNFVLFSGPAVESKANLHMVGESSGPTNLERVRQQMGLHGTVQELAGTNTTQTAYMEAAQVRWLPPPTPLPLPLRADCSTSVGLEKGACVRSRQPPPLLPLPSSDSETREGTNLSKDTITNSRMSFMSSEKGQGTQDLTATSPSRYSASSTERSCKVTDPSIKKEKAGVAEASNYRIEDASEMANVKKSSNSKRMRTAEMHNQSERKRRVKINDKLRILQELIPNGNKPDKASLLEAVIDYVKLLQSQLQLGTDMGMGVGVGMSMRMGMGMMDPNVAAMRAGCTLMPMPIYPGQPPTGFSSHSSALQTADQLQARGIVNAHNCYVAPSQVQHPPMNLNMSQSIPMYNAYIAQPQLQVHPRLQPHPLPGNSGKKPVN